MIFHRSRIADLRRERIIELKAARGHMMPPPLRVCNGLASPAVATCRICTEKVLKLFDTRQHRFDVDSNILSYPAPLSLVQFRSKCNQFICWW